MTDTARREPIRWDQLQALVQHTERDRKAARRSILFATQASVLERFGMPSDLEYDNRNRVYLKYELADAQGEVQRQVSFTLMDGRVVDYGSWDKDADK